MGHTTGQTNQDRSQNMAQGMGQSSQAGQSQVVAQDTTYRQAVGNWGDGRNEWNDVVFGKGPIHETAEQKQTIIWSMINLRITMRLRCFILTTLNVCSNRKDQ